MDSLEPERVPDALHLVDEGLDRPQLRIVGPRRLAAPELVEEHEAAFAGKRGECLERQVASTRTAVQGEQWQPARRLAVTEDAEGGLPVAKRKGGSQPIVQVSPA